MKSFLGIGMLSVLVCSTSVFAAPECNLYKSDTGSKFVAVDLADAPMTTKVVLKNSDGVPVAWEVAGADITNDYVSLVATVDNEGISMAIRSFKASEESHFSAPYTAGGVYTLDLAASKSHQAFRAICTMKQ